MKLQLNIEYVFEFIFGIFFFGLLKFEWWWFPVLLFLPDITMIGYLINTRIGATIYNIGHNKALAIILIIGGYVLVNNIASLAGAILLAHIAMDRLLGFGLKYSDSFKNTHLGKIK